MGPPPDRKASHGRLNPVGISYLYLANHIDTAVSEVRPWIGSKITAAEFILKRDISVINFSNKVFVNEPQGEEHEAPEFTWRELITLLFSNPFDPRDDTAYVPTQYVTEKIKQEGFDDILYDSALNKNGYNITLFDQDIVEPKTTFQVEVMSIKHGNRVSEI